MRSILAALLIIFSLAHCTGQKMHFELHEIGEFRDRMGQTSLVDVDNDNDLDWVFGRFGDMYWYEYKSADEWDLHEIGKGAWTDVGGWPADINQDGMIDFVVGDSWYENTDTKGGKWTIHETLVPPGGNRTGKFGLALRTWVEDMDGDKDPDIVLAEADTKNGRVFWFENQRNAGKFIFHPISDDITNQDFHSLAIADFDGDGDLDVSSGGGPLSQDIHKLFIWENISGDAARWKEPIILEGRRIHEAVAADVEGDGDIDICTKPWHGGLHIYLENKLIE